MSDDAYRARLATVLRICLVIGLVGLLEAAIRGGLVSAATILPPTEMAASLVELVRDGSLDGDIAASFGAVAAAAIIAIGGGFALGSAIHAFPAVRGAVEPLLASYYAVPTFMFYPVMIILFGVGRGAIVAISVLLAIVAMITATLNGLDRIPPVLRRTARVFGLGPVQTSLKVTLPAALPYLFTGVKLAVAYSFIGVIASEFILSGAGLGYAIAYAYNNFNNRTMYGLMLLVILAVGIVNAILNAVDRRLQARLAR